MSLAALEGIRRPDEALFSELSGQCGQGWVWVGPDHLWPQTIQPGTSPPSLFPIPGLGSGRFVHGRGLGVGGILLSHHLSQTWA